MELTKEALSTFHMELTPETLSTIAVFLILFGAVNCFFGKRIFKVMLGIWGFLIVGGIAGTVAFGMSEGNTTTVIAAGVVGGIVGCLVMLLIYKVGLFILGAGLGVLVGMAISTATGNPPQPAVFLVLTIAGGILAIIFEKLMIVINTSFGGAYSVVIGISYFLTGNFPRPAELTETPSQYIYTAVGIWILLGLFGIATQYHLLGDKEED